MPCNSDYMDPNKTEQAQQEVAGHLHHVLTTLGRPGPVRSLLAASRDLHGKGMDMDLSKATATLCAQLGGLSKDDEKKVMGNISQAKHRDLFVWWEEHKAADRERVAKESAVRTTCFDVVKALHAGAFGPYPTVGVITEKFPGIPTKRGNNPVPDVLRWDNDPANEIVFLWKGELGGVRVRVFTLAAGGCWNLDLSSGVASFVGSVP